MADDLPSEVKLKLVPSSENTGVGSSSIMIHQLSLLTPVKIIFEWQVPE